MDKFCVGDIVKLKINSKLDKLYYFSKKKYETFIVLSISINDRIEFINFNDRVSESVENVEIVEVSYNFKLISLIDFLKFSEKKIKINTNALPSYTSKNFYKIDRRLILEKKEDYFINKIMSR
jgi:hypothetical protein